ncbi:MAG: hypothetical protein WCT32_02025 [Patescibacteria group bacterium]|jgi:hypothetical protein
MQKLKHKMTIQISKTLLGCTILFLSLLASRPAFTLAESDNAALGPELAACLKEKMGEETYGAIKSGVRQATSDESKKGEECFAKFGSPLKKSGQKKSKAEFSDKTKTCLAQALGSDYESKLQNADSTTRAKAQSCFGSEGDESKKIPDSVKKCVIQNAGETEANKMFAGERPSEDSEIYKKLDGAGCFKSFQHGGSKGKMEDVPEEKRSCIKKIMGDENNEPTDDQRQRVGKECFGGQKEGDSSRQKLPSNVESCLKENVGSSYRDKSPETMSAEEKDKASECFSKNNFQPEGSNPRGKAPSMSESTKSCVEGITGQSISGSMNFTDDVKNKINSQCFGGKADTITGEGGARGKSQDEQNSCVRNIVGDSPGPYTGTIMDRLNTECYTEQQTEKNDNPRATSDSQACVARLSSDTSIQMSYEEKQAQINKECFSNLNYGKAKDEAYDSGQTGGAPGSSERGSRPEESANRSRPGGCQDDACVQQYCAANPGACGSR